ncbi:MAG TPA: hypothetical protein VFQ65_01170 [Kofleriaceae bacterium]|nr:hypothetical protein [Kofleriaceae bacterium]
MGESVRQAARNTPFASEGEDTALATYDQLEVLPFEIMRRAGYLLMFLLSAPRVIASAGTNALALALFVWSALALLFATREPHIPNAIVHRPRATRLGVWADAALLRFGELPLAPCGHSTHVPCELAPKTTSPTTPR